MEWLQDYGVGQLAKAFIPSAEADFQREVVNNSRQRFLDH
jgi:hypothetical protein